MGRHSAPDPPRLQFTAPAKRERSEIVYWSFAIWTVSLGIVLMCAPKDWFGPSWSYFHHVPHNGFWMGVTLTVIGVLQMIVLSNQQQLDYLKLGVLFLCAGTLFWTAGITLGAEGLMGHQGLMEAPFMCYVGAHKFTYSAILLNHHRGKRAIDKWVGQQQ